MPRVTILMPVYNAGKFLREAVDSILAQSFSDFEFLIIDDGSSDGSQSIIRSYDDSRIRLMQNEKNLGVAATLNRGLDLARCEYIARMDADDISMHHRLGKQIHFMDENPKLGVSGTWIRLFGDQPRVVDRCPVGASVVKAYMLFDNPMFHPTVIMRRDAMHRFGLLYDHVYYRTEDFDLWTRAVGHFPLDNLPVPLVRFRCHYSSVTSMASDIMKQQACAILRRGLAQLQVEPTEEELDFHYAVAKGHRFNSVADIRQAEQWLDMLSGQNRKTGYFPEKAFSKVIGMIWFRLCRNSTPLGVWIWKAYRSSIFSAGYLPPADLKLRFFLSIVFHLSRRKFQHNES